MVSLEMIYDAQRVLRDVAIVTPTIAAPKIGENVYIKSENLQTTGSFKLRGAYYKIHCLTEEERSHGVIACSAGNHAQGVALAATKKGIKSTICIPMGAPLSKIEATKSYGGEVVLVEGVYDDAHDKAIALMEENNYTFIHPFDDDRVIAGQGTIGLEILNQLPDVDAVVVPIGGGGLISGVAYAIKAINPDCKVYGVQAEAAACMFDSIEKQEIVQLNSVSTMADGIAVKRPGDLTFEMCKKYVDEIVTVTEDEIAAAILKLMEEQKTVAEGAGVVSVAAAMFGKLDPTHKKVCCVVSGGNIDVTALSKVITRGLVKTGRITEFTTTIQDKPGQLIKLMQLIHTTGANTFSVNIERENTNLSIDECFAKTVVETRNVEHRMELYTALRRRGYQLYDIHHKKDIDC